MSVCVSHILSIKLYSLSLLKLKLDSCVNGPSARLCEFTGCRNRTILNIALWKKKVGYNGTDISHKDNLDYEDTYSFNFYELLLGHELDDLRLHGGIS